MDLLRKARIKLLKRLSLRKRKCKAGGVDTVTPQQADTCSRTDVELAQSSSAEMVSLVAVLTRIEQALSLITRRPKLPRLTVHVFGPWTPVAQQDSDAYSVRERKMTTPRFPHFRRISRISSEFDSQFIFRKIRSAHAHNLLNLFLWRKLRLLCMYMCNYVLPARS